MTMRIWIVVGAFAMILPGAWGALRATTAGQYPIGLSYLAISLFAFTVMAITARRESNHQNAQGASDTGKPARRIRWTAAHLTRIVEALADIAKASRQRQEAAAPACAPSPVPLSPAALPATPLQLPPVKASARGGPAREPGIPTRYRALDAEFTIIQDRVGLSGEEARRMRVEVFARAARAVKQSGLAPYPRNVDPRIVAIRIEFARFIRPFLKARPVRGASFCVAAAELVVKAIRQPDSHRLVRLLLEETLLIDYTIDELIAWCLWSWQFSAHQIAGLLGNDVLVVERDLHEVSETLNGIGDRATKLLEAHFDIDHQLSVPQIYLAACTEWMLGFQAA
jgi:hypothetical protein